MPKECKIQYNPKLTVKANAKKNGVTEDAIRYYIRTRGVDRRYEEKKKVLKSMKDYLKEHPNASKAEVARQSGRGINTVVRYWDILQGKKKLQPNLHKANLQEQRAEAIKNRHIAYLDKLPVEFIREYLQARETASNAPKEVAAEVVEVAKQAPVEVVEAPKKIKAPKVAEEIEQAHIAETCETKLIITESQELIRLKSKKRKRQERHIEPNSDIRCTDKFVYFYQNTPLSNWWTSEPYIPYDGHLFASSEALFMYLKAKVFRDDVIAEIMPKTHYDAAKALGGIVRNFSEDVWHREREKAMYIALKAKLAVDEAYKSTLLSEEYRGKTFVEASPSDSNWGIKQSIDDAYNGAPWKGLNLLGKLHTILRDELLGLREPQVIEITPITDEEVRAIKQKRITKGKNTYSTDGALVRSVIGGIIGDIAGSSREGYSNSDSTPQKLLTASSYFTDDSAMTIAVAEWLKSGGEIPLKENLIKWYNKYPNVGFGSLFKEFIEKGEAQPSNANGGAMRVAPCALYANSLSSALKYAEMQCVVSHTTKEAIDGAKAIAAAIYLAKRRTEQGKTEKQIKKEIKSYIEENFGYNLDMTLEEIQARSKRLQFESAIYKITDIKTLGYQNMSSAALSCPMAIMAFLMSNNYEEAIRYSLIMGGDADSIACMAGSIAAQVYGIPKQLIDEALVYLPAEMIEVLSAFEPKNNFAPTKITPPEISKWTEQGEIIVYGKGDDYDEDGVDETKFSRYNKKPRKGYPIPTIGKTIDEIKDSVDTFIDYAKQHPELRFHIRKVGYDKAGYTIGQIAPLFNGAKDVTNILLPKEMINALNW